MSNEKKRTEKVDNVTVIRQVFTGGKDWKLNACLNFLHDQSGAYAVGYKLASDILVSYVAAKKRNQDTLVYPICFLYHHYIELRLKGILNGGSKLIGEPRAPKHTHKIDKLWGETKDLIQRLWPEESGDKLGRIEHLLNEFSELDPESMAFRYPRDKKGKRHLPEIRHINFKVLYDRMEEIAGLLDGVDAAIEHGLDNIFDP